MSLTLFLQVLACVLLFLAASNHVNGNPYVNLGWAGMFCWVLSLVIR